MDGSFLENGVIILNKPPGLICHELTTLVKKMAKTSRAGHVGTLDPNVSGVVPVALGKATKLIQYMDTNVKTYVGIMKFKNDLLDSQIETLFSKFKGTITQTPPKISAVRKVPRKRMVHSLDILERSGKIVLFKAVVEAGTYIRTLCEDMGKEVGGARMEELRRTCVGNTDESQGVTLQELSDALWLYHGKKDARLIRAMVKKPEQFINLPTVTMRKSASQKIIDGMPLKGADLIDPPKGIVKNSNVKVMREDGAFAGIGKMITDSQKIEDGKSCILMERMHLKTLI